MKPPPFDYVAARSPEEALDALAAGGEDAKPIAGGQSLVPALNMRLVRPSLLVDLNRAGLDRLERTDGEVHVGATVRQAALERSPLAHPLARAALPHVGHVATRARGTVGGSVAHADGAAELPLCLLAAGGRAVVDGPAGRREVEADDLFVTHYLTTLAPGELLVETVWPVPPEDAGHAFEEQALRAGDYALAMAAVSLRRRDGAARDVRVAVGAVVDRPMLLPEAGAALEGAEVDAAAAREAGAAAVAAVDPPGSVHASAAYLRHLAGVLVERAALRAWEDAA